MTYKSMKDRWEDDKAIDFIVELPAYELESLEKDEIVKFNPYHDKRGRFASKNGSGVSGAVASVGGTTKEEDDAYMAAVNSGDMETAQRMLREKAERMGVEMFDTVETTSYKIRTDAPPTQTVKAYKVFFVDENGDPSALFVEGTSALPKDVWLDAQDAFHFQADNGKMYTPSRKNPNSDGSGKTGASIKIPNDEVRQQLIDQGFLPEGSTAKNVVALAYRPGWHAGDLPFFPQGGKQGNPQYNESGEENKRYDPNKPTTNYANIHRRNQVVFEVELAADTNYTQNATIKSGPNKGKTKYTDMQEMPTNGYYEFATNPMTSSNDLGKWYISGSMKINRALSQEECDNLLTKNGFKVQEWEGGSMSLDKLNVNPNKTDKYKKLPDAVTYDDDGNVIPLSQRMDPNSADVRKVELTSNGGELNLKQDEFTNNSFSIYKADEDKRLIFGWASVAVRTDGEQVVDLQKDMIDTEDLEEAVYDYVLEFRDSGEEHIADLRKKGRMVESVIFTKEKMKAMGIPEGTVPEGWWIGFYIDDDDAWEKVKNGTYQMFSIEGQGVREEVKDPEPEVTKSVAKSFKEIIEKYNPYHDKLGRFTSGNGGGAATVRPYSGKATITQKQLSKENVDKNIEKVRAACSNEYNPIKKEPVNIAKVKERGGCSDSAAQVCASLADGIYSKVSAAEPKITGDVVGTVAGEKGKMYGLAHRMKQPTSMAGKIAADAKEDNVSYEKAASKIKDAVRYTAVFEPNDFVNGYKNTKSKLESMGYEEVRCKNFFDMYENGRSCQKAVQCVYKDPEGNLFELQFHTTGTQGAKEVNHRFYEEQRAATTTKTRKKQLTEAMTKISSHVESPAGVLDIPSHG